MTILANRPAATAATIRMYKVETGETIPAWLAVEYLHRSAEAITYRDGWSGDYDDAFAQASADAIDFADSLNGDQ